MCRRLKGRARSEGHTRSPSQGRTRQVAVVCREGGSGVKQILGGPTSDVEEEDCNAGNDSLWFSTPLLLEHDTESEHEDSSIKDAVLAFSRGMRLCLMALPLLLPFGVWAAMMMNLEWELK